jgi:hypothetical protein
VIWVAESTVNEAAGNPPNETSVAPVKPVPVIVTLYPPATGPPGGITLVIAGGRVRLAMASGLLKPVMVLVTESRPVSITDRLLPEKLDA